MELIEKEERAIAGEPMETLQDKLRRIQALIESGTLNTTSDNSACKFCFGTGMEVVEGKGARRCRCRTAALYAERLPRIPPRYKGVTLDGLFARPELHPKQKLVVELLKSNPLDSYVLCGKKGTGKTHFLWALFDRVARRPERKVAACTMAELIEQYYAAFQPNQDGSRKDEDDAKVEVRPRELRQQSLPYSLFFDDIDKIKMTEYVAAQIHSLFDAAYNYKHQIVVTTNLSPERLEEHFEKIDERYGGATVRRIIHSENNLIELF